MAVIAMGGLSGGGARSVGPAVAEKLAADYVDRLILANVAKEVGATVEALHQKEERPPTRGERFSRFLQRVLERSAVTSAGGDPYFGPGVTAFLTEEYEDLPQPTITRGHELEEERYINAIQTVITDLASEGNVVIVGKASYVILRDTPGVLRVGLFAELKDRVAVVMERERLSLQEAEETLLARDKARTYFFKRFFGIDDPDNRELFHMVINTSHVSPDHAVDLVTMSANAMDQRLLAPKLGVAV
jgi:cytidylate kinase